MPINPADAALLDAVPGEGAIEGPIATGAAALPAAASPASATPPVASMAPVAPAPPVAPLPPELQGTQDAIDQGIAAAGEVGAAKAQASADLAQVAADNRVQHEAAAQEAADLRAEHSRAAQAAEDQTQQALEHARDSHIPNFWAGREGARTSSTLMVALGGAAAGLLGTSKNGAAEIIQGNVDSYYRREKEKVDNLYKFAEAKGRMQDDLRLRQAAELAELQVQHGATNLAIADHITEITNASQGRVDVAEAKALAAKIAAEGQKNILAGRETLARINLQNAQAQKARAVKATGDGGPAAGAAYDKFKAAVLAGNPDVGALAAAAHIKPAQIAAQVKTIREEADNEEILATKARKSGTGPVDPKLVVRDVDGKPIGTSDSARQTKDLNTQIRNFHDAHEKLVRLRKAKFVSTRAPEFHDAVLAVATTTTAGATDANVTHEKGTLTNSFGLPDNDAIDAKIAELETRSAEIKNQLNPLPDGYTDAKSGGAHPRDASIGTTKDVGGKTYKKVGPNDWQPVGP